MAYERRKNLLVGQIAGRAEEHEGIGLNACSLASRLKFAAQLCEFFEQFERERDAGQIQFQIALQAHREPRAPQRVAA